VYRAAFKLYQELAHQFIQIYFASHYYFVRLGHIRRTRYTMLEIINMVQNLIKASAFNLKWHFSQIPIFYHHFQHGYLLGNILNL